MECHKVPKQASQMSDAQSLRQDSKHITLRFDPNQFFCSSSTKRHHVESHMTNSPIDLLHSELCCCSGSYMYSIVNSCSTVTVNCSCFFTACPKEFWFQHWHLFSLQFIALQLQAPLKQEGDCWACDSTTGQLKCKEYGHWNSRKG